MENKDVVQIDLRIENHNSEYELQNIVNIFKPYMGRSFGEVQGTAKASEANMSHELGDVSYLVVSSVDQNMVSAKVLKGDQILAESSLDVGDESVMSQITGRDMPWGVLTGIRPTKVVHNYKKAKHSDSSINRKLIEDYCISREKVSLMMEIASKEEEILSQNKEDEISLYIGIPFCPTRCLYCSFTSYSLKDKGDQVDIYLDALIKEINYVSQNINDRPVRSLYIGGGTPTSLNDAQLERLLVAVDKCFNIGDIGEYTIEAGRPDTLNRNKLKIMKRHKVDRLSINPQTMNQKTLDEVGRSHTVEDIINIFNIAREEGHNNINMDLIVGLPGEKVADVSKTMEEIRKLKPDSITVHTMAIKRASRLKEEIEEYDLTKVADIQRMLEITARGAKEMGMEPYYMYRQKDTLGNFENVGYATLGKESIYNIQMIAEQETIIAMGAGAVTKAVSEDGNKIERIPNVKNLEQYIQRVDEMIERKYKCKGTVHK